MCRILEGTRLVPDWCFMLDKKKISKTKPYSLVCFQRCHSAWKQKTDCLLYKLCPTQLNLSRKTRELNMLLTSEFKISRTFLVTVLEIKSGEQNHHLLFNFSVVLSTPYRNDGWTGGFILEKLTVYAILMRPLYYNLALNPSLKYLRKKQREKYICSLFHSSSLCFLSL